MPNNKNLAFAHLNARSLMAHIVLFRDLIIRKKYPIVAVSETWLCSNIHNDVVCLENYKVYRQDRNGRGGGVMLYVSNVLESKLIVMPQSETEQLWIEICHENKTFAVGVIYRPPNFLVNSFFSNFEDALNLLIPKYDHILCGGDFNIDYFQIESSANKCLHNILYTYELTQIIDKPTRITDSSSTLLDYIICSKNLKIISTNVCDISEISDHQLISCILDHNKIQVKPFMYTFRDLKNLNHDNLLNDFCNIPTGSVYQSDNINDKITVLNNLILDLFDRHAPVKTVLISRKKSPWLTDTIKQMIKLRNNAQLRYKKSKLPAHWDYYKQLRNETNSAIAREKKAYLEYTIRSKNNKTLWRELKLLNVYKGKSINQIPVTIGDANTINTHFINSSKSDFTVSDETVEFYDQHIRNNTNIFTFKMVTEQQINQVLRSIRSVAVGVDGIGLGLLLYLCPNILPLLTHIVNYCFENDVYPSLWKFAKIIPLPKTNNVSDITDLRPISILPTMSKIIEIIMNQQIREHVTLHNILPLNQSGFRKGYSTTSALLQVVDDIVRSSDNNEATILVLLDYSKAFDRIDHRLLLAILHYFGFCPKSLKLMNQYITDRYQKVTVNGENSDMLPVGQGVPQGSILGPLMFTLYTAEFQNVLKNCKSHFYADDTQLYYSFKEVDTEFSCRLINQDIMSLINISNSFCLSINATKSKVMLFGRKKTRRRCMERVNIRINDRQLELTNVSKNLGLYIDSSLKFTEHTNHIIKKSFSNLKLIYTSKDMLTKKTKAMLCEALVLSHINYASVVFYPFLRQTDVQRLQRLQNSCVRLVCGIRKYDPISSHLKEIAWLNIKNRNVLHSCCFFHNILLTKSPPYLYNKITFRTDVHNLNIRRKSTITIPKHKTAEFCFGFSYRIASLYNAIPEVLKVLPCKKFKKQFKEILLHDTTT